MDCNSSTLKYAYEKAAKRRRLEEAKNHSIEKLLRRLFHAWLNHCRAKRAVESKILVRREKMDRSSKQRAFQQWRLWVWNKKCRRRKNNVARRHFERNLSKKSIAVLKTYSLRRKDKAIRLDYLKPGTALIALEVLRVHVDRWRISVVRVAHERQKNHRAEDHWSSRQLQRYFFAWKRFRECRKSKVARKYALDKIGEPVLLKKYLNLWFGRYEALEPIRSKEIQAASYYATKIQSWVFRSWTTYVREKVLRRNEIEEAHKFHRKLLLRQGLKEILKLCLYEAESRYEKKSRCARRNSAEDFDTVKKFFAKWLEVVYANDGGKDPDRLICERKNRRIFRFSRAATASRLVLPEYMLKQSSMNICGDRLPIGTFDDNWEIGDKKKTYSPCISGYTTPENSPSRCENTGSWTETHSTVKSINAGAPITNFCIFDGGK